MPSRSNPNTPTFLKPKTASTLQTKRQKTQRLVHAHKISKPTPRTSQALRRAATPSRKKARKLERKVRFARKRRAEAAGEVEMKDADAVGADKEKEGEMEMEMGAETGRTKEDAEKVERMDVDGAE